MLLRQSNLLLIKTGKEYWNYMLMISLIAIKTVIMYVIFILYLYYYHDIFRVSKKRNWKWKRGVWVVSTPKTFVEKTYNIYLHIFFVFYHWHHLSFFFKSFLYSSSTLSSWGQGRGRCENPIPNAQHPSNTLKTCSKRKQFKNRC